MAFNLTPEELAQFHAYIQQGGSLTPSAPIPALNLHPPAFQPSTQVPFPANAPAPPTQPFLNFLQQTHVQAQPSVIQPAFQHSTQASSSGPPATTQPLLSFLQLTQVQAQPSMIQPPALSKYLNTPAWTLSGCNYNLSHRHRLQPFLWRCSSASQPPYSTC